jgi:hypothetical protein
VRRAVPLLVLALVLAAGAAAAAPAGPPRALTLSARGHSLRASVVHVCLRHGASTDCSAAPVHLHGKLALAPGESVALRFDRQASSVRVGLLRGASAVGRASRARGGGTRFRWSAPRSLGRADRLDVTAFYGRSDSRFQAAIRR